MMKNINMLASGMHLQSKWGGNVIPDIIYKKRLGNIRTTQPKEILEGKEARTRRT